MKLTYNTINIEQIVASSSYKENGFSTVVFEVGLGIIDLPGFKHQGDLAVKAAAQVSVYRHEQLTCTLLRLIVHSLFQTNSS